MMRMIDGGKPSAKYKRKIHLYGRLTSFSLPSTIRPRFSPYVNERQAEDYSSSGTSIILSCREHAPRFERTFTG